MSNTMFDEAGTESFLQDGDELVFINREKPAKTVVQIIRNGQILVRKAPNGDWYPGYSLGERLDWDDCEAYAESMAASCGLTIRDMFESEGELHVRLIRKQG